jgi:hypothetical protein
MTKVNFTPETLERMRAKASEPGAQMSFEEIQDLTARTALALAAKLKGSADYYANMSEEDCEALSQQHPEIFVEIAQEMMAAQTEAETDKPSLWERVKSAGEFTDRWGGKPFYGIGYGAGYGVTMVTRPVADLIECVPLLGHIVSGARDGAVKANDHYTVCSSKAQAWLAETREKGVAAAEAARKKIADEVVAAGAKVKSTVHSATAPAQ